MGSLYLWDRSIQEMGGGGMIGRSIYGVVVIDGSLYSQFYGTTRDAIQHVQDIGNYVHFCQIFCIDTFYASLFAHYISSSQLLIMVKIV